MPSDFYDRYIRVLLSSYLRPELKFNGIDELKAAINKDIETSRFINAELLSGGHTVDAGFLQVILENIANQQFHTSESSNTEHKRWQNIDWDIKEEA